MECVCDYEMPSAYNRTLVKAARKPHKCRECGRMIQPGEPYENAWGIWEGRSNIHHTCRHCLDLREYVKAHVPCFCWAHGNTREDAMSTAQGWAHEAPGLLFGAWRREVRIRRAREHQRKEIS